jgi:hypothetical protein
MRSDKGSSALIVGLAAAASSVGATRSRAAGGFQRLTGPQIKACFSGTEFADEMHCA